MSQTAAGMIRQKLLERTQAGKPSDGEWIAIGLLAVADALDSVSTSIDNLATEVRDSDGVAAKLGDIATELDALARALPR